MRAISSLLRWRFWVKPPTARAWIAVPIAYTLAAQLLLGIPQPQAFEREDSSRESSEDDSGIGRESLAAVSEIIHAPPPGLRNFLHIPLFFVLAWLWRWSLETWTRSTAGLLVLTIAICVGYAVFSEALQALVPTRHLTLTDMAMNVAGVAIGLACYQVVRRRVSGLSDRS